MFHSLPGVRVGVVAVAVQMFAVPASAAGLGLAEAVELARSSAPALQAADAALAAANALRTAAATLPDPRLAAGIENWPIAGPDRWQTTRDAGTMQRLALMQDVPHRAKREARTQLADARIERERAMRGVVALAVRREVSLAWVAAYHAERRVALLDGVRRENELLQQTLPARVAAGSAPPAELAASRLEALALDDRRDELVRDVHRARADLRRWVGVRAGDALDGSPQLPVATPADLRERLQRHADLVPFAALRTVAAAERAEAVAEKHGDWSWEIAYSRRPRYDDMVSFQLSVTLPWQRERRQQPGIDAKHREAERIDAEREDVQRRVAAELDAMLAETAAIDSQLARLEGPGLALATERASLSLASYQSGRGDLAAVLAARAQVIEQRLRAVELASRRDALRVRLAHLSVE